MSEKIHEKIVDLLNEMFRLDPKATDNLLKARVRCNNAVVDHPNVVVMDDDDGNPVVGLLGLLNGLTKPELRVCSQHTDDGKETLLGFGFTRDYPDLPKSTKVKGK